MAEKSKGPSKPLLPIFKQVTNSVPQSLQKPKALPGDKSFIGPVTSVQKAEGAVRAAKSAMNQTGITAQQKADRSKTLGRAQMQLAKEKAKVTPKPDPKKPDPKKPDPKKPKPTKKKVVTKKVVKKDTASTDTSTNTDNTEDTTQNDTSVSAVPETPEAGVTGDSESPKTYKPATPDLILLQEEAFPAEVMTDLLFEDIGGTEILNLARHDLVSGIDIKYQQISNLSKIETIYGGANLIALQNTSEQVFKKYPLSRYTFVPDKTDDPSGFNSPVYLDSDGNLVVELTALDNSYQVEIEFQSADTNDIIY
jgi:hypothetical protein